MIPVGAESERAEMLSGLATMVIGFLLFLLAVAQGALALFVAGGLLIGLDQGISSRGSLAALQAAAPAVRRGEVMTGAAPERPIRVTLTANPSG
jgi:hypothetical protein